ncbi:aminopeptidase [Neptunitalea chrysea]|uniref:Aminopeptidase n=1 Tax=Neptunitalea chrysea TaxID=1647581 RepID=A0A9W6B2Y6_9FLAO|nr:M28 family peptidase [Neptunitalea chrysea]GLB51483.1 aminopeptidase [Neptunitalea chrysea]
MKTVVQFIAGLIVVFAIYISFNSLLPSNEFIEKESKDHFSTNKALKHVKALSSKPHYVGCIAHEEVGTYLKNELKNLGLEPFMQIGYTAGDWANLSKATNIMARIRGTKGDKALVLLSHYDSHPHTSFGASDAGSGVAAVLEGVRLFLASGKQPVNDIIILFTDAEELGLNGAQLFVNNHDWIQNVGLVLNFEARGSGGPSYMLIETNEGNTGLVHEFKEANPEFPVGNSFMYSIYKLLPNDTDLTVFREDAGVNGFNFAFIDDHFDYHSQLDTYENLDVTTLAHQGSYIEPLLAYFSMSDLTKVKNNEDSVYFNMPFFKLVSYPFSFIIPMLIIATVLFVAILIYGKRVKVIELKKVAVGFIPTIIVLVINGLIGYYIWPLLKVMYPGYKDILHGFTYNGHWYIAACVAISIGVCFLIYQRYKKMGASNLVVAPIFVWLLITTALSIHLKGGAFFVIPLYVSLLLWFLKIKYRKISIVILALLSTPVLFILAPFIQMFPVGLGLKMMIASTLFVTLIFGLLLPLFMKFDEKNKLGVAGVILTVVFVLVAHVKSKFTVDTPKPSSLIYVHDADTGKSFYGTYDQNMTSWVKEYITNSVEVTEVVPCTFSSKYGTPLAEVSSTEQTVLTGDEPLIEKVLDTVYENERHLKITITPQRPVNRLELFSDNVAIHKMKVNGVEVDVHFLESRVKGAKLITHYISNNDATILEVTLAADDAFQMMLLEISNDLLSTPELNVSLRPNNEIPMPFVVNDATVIKKIVEF